MTGLAQHLGEFFLTLLLSVHDRVGTTFKGILFNPVALRKAKILCNRVKVGKCTANRHS